MKKTITLTVATILSLGLMSFELLSDDGSKTNRTGGHGEPNCSSCHGSVGSGSISVSATPSLSSGYTAGTSYTIHLTVTESSKIVFGIDFQALNSSNANAGTLTAGTDNHKTTTSGLDNITHNFDGGYTPATHTFNFTWVAPATSTGNVTFWFSGVAGNHNGSDSGDDTYTGSSVIAPATSTMTVAIVGNNVTCNGANNGSATATPTGGTAPYTYAWTPSGGTASTAVGLSAGTYTCTVTGSPGGPATQTVTITQPAILAATTSQIDVTCFGGANGSATVTPSGGTQPYAYAWSPSGATSATASGLTAETHTCIITGSGSATCTLTKTFNILQPTAITSTISSTPENGTGNGTATIIASGGTGTLNYLWAPGGQTNATATGLTVGTYTVTVTDANNCTYTNQTTVGTTVGINSNSIQSAVNVYPNPSKAGFSVEINAASKKRYSLKVVNSVGEIIYEDAYELQPGKNLLPVNLDDKAEGSFIIKVLWDEGMLNIPFVKLK